MPVNMLLEISNSMTPFNPEKLLGKIPVSEFEPKLTTDTFASIPISEGKHPVSPLLDIIISSNVLDILPMLLGIQPPS